MIGHTNKQTEISTLYIYLEYLFKTREAKEAEFEGLGFSVSPTEK